MKCEKCGCELIDGPVMTSQVCAVCAEHYHLDLGFVLAEK